MNVTNGMDVMMESDIRGTFLQHLRFVQRSMWNGRPCNVNVYEFSI
jgi:hypothetical protein